MAARKLTIGEAIVIKIVAQNLKRDPADFDADTELNNGYHMTTVVKEAIGCKSILSAQRIRVREIAESIPTECFERYQERLNAEKEVVGQ